ncbi:hypothetical protein AB0I60_22790 [Actinosynnema sp. NPDC050436]|uniref:hypothetical protein n=1 Tax=Actinosynnema sp. NPDC050436 TaxID=3155659 RepID=UPI0033D650B3
MEWGAQAALAGVVGNAIYDGAKSAVRRFARRVRKNGKAHLDEEEARAFARYVLAYLTVYRGGLAIDKTSEPPAPVAVERAGEHWICRFEVRKLTRHREKRNLLRDRRIVAAWITTIERGFCGI